MSKHPKFGALGTFSQGKLNKSDEGDLQLGVATDHKNQVVVVNFGKKVMWFGMPKAQALQFAEFIKKHAEELD